MSSPGGDDVVLLPSDPRGSPAEQFVQGLQRRALERERRNAAAAAAALEGSALGATMPLDDGELDMSMLLASEVLPPDDLLGFGASVAPARARQGVFGMERVSPAVRATVWFLCFEVCLGMLLLKFK